MDIIIYTGPMCPYCDKAKALLQSKELEYKEIYVGDDPDLMMEMIDKANGRRSVPQIFIKDNHVGGFDDLYAIDKSGELDKLLI
ncbi:MAG: glutaredoxin 3 [Rhodobiaceae bacterium]|nr:glutaredoxin 3 [Rhodobiaceae bacterium]|tara:strand:- start:2638 stop:2889 length:252 start_codon:yes stop_codon:yes gene_type:complete